MSTGIEVLNPGELRRRITFQSFSREQDEMGGFVEEWTDVLSCWAKIDPRVGREAFAADQYNAALITEITIRWQPGLDESMRILDEYQQQYDIKYLSDVEMRHQLLVIGTVKLPADRNAAL
ncbi:MAG TPA: phage head closure protein [Scandinavium sp.]|jgi:SPP1 family predicted phage head-tail adaptor|uniref:phage head closure protein n=1 Tax=Scandinavium sp. TaxID=2830653 RepID=UPI002E37EF66|nr:phage head closure protein [Scandinavium sp.]HEX4499853.1 phage head closure protein [Scandinavium sp.]